MLRELEPGDPVVMGPYRLRGQLGVGGMGRVFLGLSAGGRLVAVKVIRAELATDPEFRGRFQREVAAARKVSHQFTAPVIDADLDGLVPWLATAYVAGPSLADAVAEYGPLAAASVLQLAAGLAEGLSAIHAAGVVHRDLKPSNVLLASDGPRVIDFGISLTGDGGALTRTGLVVGSPGFMSPEQAEGREVGPASDIFSLGAVLTFAATGQGPFGTGSNMTLVHRLVSGQADLDRVPAEVRPLVERCLAADPRERPTARVLLAETAAGQPEPGSVSWPPDPVTRSFSSYPTQAGTPVPADPAYVPTTISPFPVAISHQPTQAFAPQTVASARLTPPSQPQPHASRRRGRLGGRLVIALVVTGLAGALGAGGVSLAAFAHESSGVHGQKFASTHMIHQHMLAPRPTRTATMAPVMVPPMSPTATPTMTTATPTPTMTTAAPTPTMTTATPTPTMTTPIPTPSVTATDTPTATPTPTQANPTGTVTATP
ncbi:MAG: serine/threonine-protein kinase [Streptosporangiaceae bacterium]